MSRILSFLAFAVCLMSCSDVNASQNPDAKLSVYPETLSFPVDGGTQTISIAATEKPGVVSSASWCFTLMGAYKEGKVVVEVKVAANTSDEERSTELRVTCADLVKNIKVLQDKKETSSQPGTTPPAEEPEVIPDFPSGDPADQAASIGLGWNLGNHMDAYSNGVSGETFWGNPAATQETFTKLREYGFTHVRIPVTWLGHIGNAPDYKIDEKWLNRVYEIVGYAENAGLVTIINIHHDGADSAHWLDIKTAATDASVHQQVIDQIKAMWTQIAEKFKGKGDFLIFESMNEIHDGGWGWGANRTDGGKQYKCFNEWQQAFVDAVRATGGNNSTRYLGIPGYCTNPDITVEQLVLPNDSAQDRLMVAVHCYDPYKYCLEASFSEWGHTASEGKKESWGDEEHIVSVFKKLYDRFVSKGIPVYMGEMGCVNRSTPREQAFQQYYFEFYAKVARTYGIVPYVWDNGAAGSGNEKHAFINHSTGKYCSNAAKAAMEAFLKGMFTEGEDYTLKSIYTNAPK